MKAESIILQLMDKLPQFTEMFSGVSYAESVSVSGSVVTVNQLGHGLIDNQVVAFTDGVLGNSIIGMTDNGNGTQTITVAEESQLTNNWQQTVRFSSVLNPSIDGDYPLIEVDDERLVFIVSGFTVPGTTPVDALLQEDRDFSVNGLFNITKVDDDVFTYQLVYDNKGVTTPYELDGAVVDVLTFKIHNVLRITGSANVERMIVSYDAQEPDDFYLCVVLDDTAINKNSDTVSDNDMEQSAGLESNWNGLMKFPFSVFCLATIDEKDLSGRKVRDEMSALRANLFKSLLGTSFPTGFTNPADSAVYPMTDGAHEYKPGYYIHRFDFAQVADISNDDVAENSKTTALSTISFDINNENGNLLIGSTVEFNSNEDEN